jgi:NAD(P)-dependent dehydrogenase (short-subunit alcohol dehydrogenase family)
LSTKSLEIADDGWSSSPAAGTALVFGAAGGIGSAIVRRLQIDRGFTKVITFSRRSMPAIDLLSDTSLQDAAALASVEFFCSLADSQSV